MEQSQLSELLLRLLSVLPSAVFGIYPNGSIFLWSERAKILTAIDSSQALGKNFQSLFLIDPGASPLNTLLETRSQASIEVNKLSDLPKNLILTLTPLLDDEGKLIGALGEIKDISEEKHFEEAKSDFIAMAAHELRTPAATVKGYLDALKREGNSFSEDARQYLDRAVSANDRQIQTIESIFNAVHLEEGTLKVRLESINLINLLNEVVGEFLEIARSKGLELKLIYPHFALHQVFADPTRVKEISRNLLENAIKYTQKGKITISCEEQEEKLITKISDTGPGIPPQLQSRLFEKFTRGERALTESTQGLGLGLYITKKLVELMGGKIWYETKIDRGTTFYFSLPMK